MAETEVDVVIYRSPQQYASPTLALFTFAVEGKMLAPNGGAFQGC